MWKTVVCLRAPTVFSPQHSVWNSKVFNRLCGKNFCFPFFHNYSLHNPQTLWRKFCVKILTRNFTAVRQGGMFFLVAAQERTKEDGWGEALMRSLSMLLLYNGFVPRLRATLSNYGVIATGNHINTNSLRGAPPPDPLPGQVEGWVLVGIVRMENIIMTLDKPTAYSFLKLAPQYRTGPPTQRCWSTAWVTVPP